MSFTGNLASSPNNSSIYGQPSQGGDPDVLSLVNTMKNREMADFKEKANFMSDLSLKQDRLKKLFDPEQSSGGQTQNTVMAQDPNQMTGYQKGELGIRQQEANTESQKLAQQNKFGQESQDLKTKQEALNQQKSDQINADKNKKMQDDMDQYKGKLDLAYQQLQDKNTSAEQQLELHKTIAENTEAYHKLQMAQQQDKFEKSQSDHKDAMKNMQDKLDQASHSKTTTQMNADGTKKTVETDKGGTVQVQGKDGKTYEIPADKADEWNQQHAPDGDNSAYRLNPQ